MAVWPNMDDSMECISIIAVQLANNIKLYNFVLNGNKVSCDKF